MQNLNKGMEEDFFAFCNGNKVELMGFLMSDIMGVQGAIVNGVEIGITMIPILIIYIFNHLKITHMVE